VPHHLLRASWDAACTIRLQADACNLAGNRFADSSSAIGATDYVINSHRDNARTFIHSRVRSYYTTSIRSHHIY
jgi:hypothetical protein